MTDSRNDLQPKNIEELRRLWQQARNSETPGVPAEEVLARLERKYQALSQSD